MAIIDTLEKVGRVVSRETVGAIAREKAKRADNQERIADLLRVARSGNPATLQPEDFVAAGREFDQDPAILHALADAESSGRGFDDRGRPVPAVEVHAFSCETNNAFDRSHPHLSWPEWIPYRKGDPPPGGLPQHPYAMSYDDRWGLWSMMAELSIEGACCALSLNRFQQLIGRTPLMKRKGLERGWKVLGFASAEALFRKLCESEFAALEVLHLYIRAHGMAGALRDRNWQAITAAYNGPGQVEAYSKKMADAYKQRARIYV